MTAPPGYTAITPTVNGTVVDTNFYACSFPGAPLGGAQQTPIRCQTSQVNLTSGRQKGQLVSVDTNTGAGSTVLHKGDRVVLATTTGPTGAVYEFFHYQRNESLLVLGLVFAAIVVAVARCAAWAP